MDNSFKIMVESDYACFSRPELKVERVSYDIPTISAIEGLIKSIYWKPSMRIIVDKIIIFNPIKFTNIRRNELKTKIPYTSMKSQMKGKGKPVSIYADHVRTQRAAMVLKDVRYGIKFHLEETGIKSDKDDDNLNKHCQIMHRRLEIGQCFQQPYLGCREFPVRKLEPVTEFPYDEIAPELKGNASEPKFIPVGMMLYKMEFRDGGIPVNQNWNNPKFSDKADAIYYKPEIVNGIVEINRWKETITC